MVWTPNRKKKRGGQHQSQARSHQGSRKNRRHGRGRGSDERRWQRRTGVSSHGYKPKEQAEPLAASVGQQAAPEAQDRPQGQTGQTSPQAANGPIDGHAGAGGEPGTRLYESKAEFQPDARLVRRAIKHRWEVDKRLSNIVLQKALTLAAGLPWTGPDGITRKEEFTPPQLIGTAKLALDIERQNQAEDHHGDRMEYYDRALQLRAANSEVPMPALNINANGSVQVGIYIPDDGRNRLEEIVEPPELI